MNPHQKNKLDVSKLSAEEQKLFRLYGKLPNKKDLLQNKLKERKYFDSGDYAMSKAGKSEDLAGGLGRGHPSPDTIPHLSQQTSNAGTPASATGGLALHPTTSHGHSGSPVKESSILQRGMTVDEQDEQELTKPLEKSANAESESIAIRE